MAQRVLTRQDRERIREGWARGDSPMEIAYHIGVAQSTVYEELRRGLLEEYYPDGVRRIYDPDRAEKIFSENIKKRGNRTPRVRV